MTGRSIETTGPERISSVAPDGPPHPRFLPRAASPRRAAAGADRVGLPSDHAGVLLRRRFRVARRSAEREDAGLPAEAVRRKRVPGPELGLSRHLSPLRCGSGQVSMDGPRRPRAERRAVLRRAARHDRERVARVSRRSRVGRVAARGRHPRVVLGLRPCARRNGSAAGPAQRDPGRGRRVPHPGSLGRRLVRVAARREHLLRPRDRAALVFPVALVLLLPVAWRQPGVRLAFLALPPVTLGLYFGLQYLYKQVGQLSFEEVLHRQAALSGFDTIPPPWAHLLAYSA